MEKTVTLEARIARFLREACPDESLCLADEEECYREHPIHAMGSSRPRPEGIESIYANVEGAAALLAGLFRELVVEDDFVAPGFVGMLHSGEGDLAERAKDIVRDA